MKWSFIFAFLAVGLLLLSGCTILHTQTQEFKEDGTSTMTLDHKLAMPNAEMDKLRTLVSSMIPISDLNYRLAQRLIQRSNEAYAAALCDNMKNATCTVGADNTVHVVANLGPDSGLYTITTANDTSNASAPVEVKTYTINKIPSVYYFSARNKTSSEWGLGVIKSITNKFKTTLPSDIDSVITANYYCMGMSPYSCEVMGNSGNTIDINLSATSSGFSSPSKLVWAGCSARNESDINDMNDTEAAAVVTKKVMVGKTPNAGGLGISVACPGGASNTLVVVTESKYTPGYNTVYAYSLLNKEAIKAVALLYLDTLEQNALNQTVNNTYIKGSTLDMLTLDLATGKFTNASTIKEMDDGIQKYQTQTDTYGIALDVQVSYSAQFPDHVANATGGSGTSIPVSNNKITLTLHDLALLGKGPIVVKTTRPLPPSNNKIFGMDPIILFGGAIAGLIVIVGLVLVLTRRPKEPAGTPMPPTSFADTGRR